MLGRVLDVDVSLAVAAGAETEENIAAPTAR